jgi:hypothetical protein
LRTGPGTTPSASADLLPSGFPLITCGIVSHHHIEPRPEVGVKCRMIRGFWASQARTAVRRPVMTAPTRAMMPVKDRRAGG